jgi:iron complex transport system substrate-binding protein
VKRTLIGLVALCLPLAACGDNSDTADTAATAATDTSVAAPTTEAVPPDTSVAVETTSPAVDSVPSRIVSLSPTATEMLFAIGAGDQVVAVDDFSNYPEEALALPNELSGFEPNVEAILEFEPDLVVHDGTTDLGASLDELGVAHWVGAAATTFDDIYTQIEQLGAATGHIAEAAELVGQMQADIDAIVAAAPAPAAALTYFHELDNTLYSVTSNTFIGQVYSLFGLENIADGSGGDSDYPQLTAEYVVSANPDLIFLADASFGESAETVAARPGWGVITAVTSGSIVGLDADIPNRWGPRVVEFVRVIADALAAVPVS